jgi:hypothetical protein
MEIWFITLFFLHKGKEKNNVTIIESKHHKFTGVMLIHHAGKGFVPYRNGKAEYPKDMKNHPAERTVNIKVIFLIFW